MTYATFLSALALQAPAATTDPMAGFYGNTLTVVIPLGGYSAHRTIDPDGTWRETNSAVGEARGKWWIENDKVCSVQTEPSSNPRHFCYPVVARQPGDRWVTTDPATGNAVFQELEPGRRQRP